MTNYQVFVDAKGAFRRHPDWSVEQVAESLNVPERDQGAMDAIREAAKDVLAGDIPTPHLQRPSPGTGM
jgi:hypothetical protein